MNEEMKNTSESTGIGSTGPTLPPVEPVASSTTRYTGYTTRGGNQDAPVTKPKRDSCVSSDFFTFIALLATLVIGFAFGTMHANVMQHDRYMDHVAHMERMATYQMFMNHGMAADDMAADGMPSEGMMFDDMDSLGRADGSMGGAMVGECSMGKEGAAAGMGIASGMGSRTGSASGMSSSSRGTSMMGSQTSSKKLPPVHAPVGDHMAILLEYNGDQMYILYPNVDPGIVAGSVGGSHPMSTDSLSTGAMCCRNAACPTGMQMNG